MQADNLTPEDSKAFEELFERITRDNPAARMRIFDTRDADLPNKCFYKGVCKKRRR